MSSTRRFMSFFTAVAAGGLFAALPSFAQEQPTDIARELAALRAEVRQLRAEVDELKSAAAAAAPSSVEMVQTQVAELAQVKVESESRMPVKVFGTVHAGVFANSANPNWLDNPNLVNAAP